MISPDNDISSDHEESHEESHEERLKRVVETISQLLDENNLMGCVSVVAPGCNAMLLNLKADWSAAKPGEEDLKIEYDRELSHSEAMAKLEATYATIYELAGMAEFNGRNMQTVLEQLNQFPMGNYFLHKVVLAAQLKKGGQDPETTEKLKRTYDKICKDGPPPVDQDSGPKKPVIDEPEEPTNEEG